MTRRPLHRVLPLLIGMAGVGVMSQPVVSHAASAPQYTIRMYAGTNLTPITPSKYNPHPPTELKVMAQRYEKLHPNIHIQFVTEPLALGSTYNDYAGWLTSQGAAGTVPDVVWNQWLQVNGGFVPQGFFINLNPYLNSRNPYVPGNKHWRDIFNPLILQEITAPNKAVYAVDADYIGTAIVYNKALFHKAGIRQAPKSFAELIGDLQKLKKRGIVPFAYDLSDQTGTSWWERRVGTELLQSQLHLFNVDHRTQYLSPLDYAAGIEKGYIQMTNPRYAEVWKLLKQFSAHWAAGATDTTSGPPMAGSSLTSSLQLVAQGKVAMTWTATTSVPWLNQSGFKNVYGAFPFPMITKATTPFSGNVNVQGVVGGPNASFQYFVPSQRADHSLTQKKLAWVVNWLQYITAPKNAQAIINQVGGTLPTIKGTAPTNPILKSLIPKIKPPLSMGSFNLFLGPQATDSLLRLVQEYITGQASYSSFAQQFDAELQSAAQAWAAQNNVNLSKYK